MPPRSVVITQVDPDYFQFYARRANAEWASDKVPSPGYEEHLWSNGGFVTIGSARKFGTAAVAVEVWDTLPDQPDEQWQHVAEVSLEPGGSLEVFSWGDDNPAAVVPIDEGWVRLRVLWVGLVAGRYEGMDEDGNSEEHLMFQLWGAPPAASAV
ncbi:MAG TPA: hypothetical protein VFM81_08600, partial [Actinomycetota bacterium]|nr:hypothetical protein [Actinomycetota bacterium]